jgi:ATP-dependent Lon protease
MIQEIEIPREVPVMTLSAAVLFPQAVMPLHIFEPRYRRMLREILGRDRIFAVASLDEERERETGGEPLRQVGGVGVVRACRKNDDGTSDLILQGLARVEFEAIVTEEPYRRARIWQLPSDAGADPEKLERMRRKTVSLIQTQIRLGAPIPKEVLRFLEQMEHPESVLDLSIYTLCPSPALKQELLETTDVPARFSRFEGFLQAEIERLKLENRLQGDLGPDSIGKN